MARKLDQVIVVDVEATCWEAAPPPGQESEIVEIGICPVDVAAGERLERRSILVKPERSTVSPFCMRLTTLTQGQVDGGISFHQACAILRDTYLTRDRVWASYGDYDRRQFERQCQARAVGYPFGPGTSTSRACWRSRTRCPVKWVWRRRLRSSGFRWRGRTIEGATTPGTSPVSYRSWSCEEEPGSRV